MINGKEISEELLQELKSRFEEIRKECPHKFRKFLIKYIEKHDYQHILHRQFDDAYHKVRFDEDLYFEGKQVINGKRTYVSKKFRDWLDTLLEGAIPYAWKNEIVKFLMRMREELG